MGQPVSLFLTPAEKIELTGYRRKSAQIAWLKRNRVPHFVNAGGDPVILRSTFDALHNARPHGSTAHQGLRLAASDGSKR